MNSEKVNKKGRKNDHNSPQAKQSTETMTTTDEVALALRQLQQQVQILREESEQLQATV